jgi:hypothetical protein
MTTTHLTAFLWARNKDDEHTIRAAYAPTNPWGDHLLKQCEANKRIVELHAHDEDEHGNRSCGQCDFGGYDAGWCETLRILALPYADHADYDEAWGLGGDA